MVKAARIKRFWLLLIVTILYQSIQHCFCCGGSHSHSHVPSRRRIYIKRSLNVSNTQGDQQQQQQQQHRQTQSTKSTSMGVSNFHGNIPLNRSSDRITLCGQRLLYAVQTVCDGVEQGGGRGGKSIPVKRFPFPRPLTQLEKEKQQTITDECCKPNIGCSGKQLMKYCSKAKKRPERTASDRDLNPPPLKPAIADSENEVTFGWWVRPRLLQLLDWINPTPATEVRAHGPVAAALTSAHGHGHDHELQAHSLHLKEIEDQLHAEALAIFREYNPEPVVYVPRTTPPPVWIYPNGSSFVYTPKTYAPNAMESDELPQDKQGYREMREQMEKEQWSAEKDGSNVPATTFPIRSSNSHSRREGELVSRPYGPPVHVFNPDGYATLIDTDVVLGI